MLETPVEQPVQEPRNLPEFCERHLDRTAKAVQEKAYDTQFKPVTQYKDDTRLPFLYRPVDDFERFGLVRHGSQRQFVLSPGLVENIKHARPLEECKLPTPSEILTCFTRDGVTVLSRFDNTWHTRVQTLRAKDSPNWLLLTKVIRRDATSARLLDTVRGFLPDRFKRNESPVDEKSMEKSEIIIDLQSFTPTVSFVLTYNENGLVVEPVISVVEEFVSAHRRPVLAEHDPRQVIFDTLFPPDSIPEAFVLDRYNLAVLDRGPWKTPETVYCLKEEAEEYLGE